MSYLKCHYSVETCRSVIIYKLIVIVLFLVFYKIIKKRGTFIVISNGRFTYYPGN